MSEREIIQFLSKGESYGLPTEVVERIETHCSIVFLVGDRAYKLKRPIAFSALDYTSLERREAACRREVELNRRTAPDVYLGVRPIHRDESGALSFKDAGPAVDYVVVMRRFEQADLFDHLAAEGRLGLDLVAALAEEVARFHQRAEITDIDGGSLGMERAIEQNRRDQSTVEAVLGQAAITNLHGSSLRALDRLVSLLDCRRSDGRIRVCHGDLRLPNICLYEGRPTLFDAIEFADDLCCIDVLYDLAFLLMDLWQRGLHVHANTVFNRYFDVTADDAGLPALPLMMSVRAGTRAFAVAGSSLRHSEPNECRRLAGTAQDLMRLASTLLDLGSPRVVAIGGGTAMDRSRFAQQLAPSLRPPPGARIVDGSVVAPYGNAKEILQGTYAAILHCPFDGTFDRQALAELIATTAVPLVGLWLGEPRQAPAAWHVIDKALETEASIAAVRRLVDDDASPRGAATPSPPRRGADETLHSRG